MRLTNFSYLSSFIACSWLCYKSLNLHHVRHDTATMVFVIAYVLIATRTAFRVVVMVMTLSIV